MRRLLLLALVLPLAVPPAAGAREGSCRERPGYEVVARSGDAVVFKRTTHPQDAYELRTYRACLRSVGRDPLLGETGDYEGEGDRVTRFVFNGRFVAMFAQSWSKYGDVQNLVSLVDAASGRRLAAMEPTTGYVSASPYDLLEAVLSEEGHLAWTEGRAAHPELRTLIDGAVQELVPPLESPVAAGGPRFEGDVLHWAVDGAPRAHRLRPIDAAPAAGPIRCRAPRGYEPRRAGSHVLIFTRRGAGRHGPFPWRACLRASPRPPFTIGSAGPRTRYSPYRVLLRGSRATLIEHDGASGWRVATWDVRRRRRVGPPVAFRGDGELADAALAGGRVALSLGAHIVLVERRRAVVVAAGSLPMTALRIDRSTVAWVERGEPRSAPLPGADASA